MAHSTLAGPPRSDPEPTGERHKSKARAWAWAQQVEPAMKLTLLAIARHGSGNREALMELTGLTAGQLAQAKAKLDARGLLHDVEVVLSGGKPDPMECREVLR